MTAMEIPAPFSDTYTGPGKPATREHDWHHIADTAPIMAATMLRYLDQIALSLRPASVRAAEGILRGFGGWIAANHPEVVGLADVERRHIEAYKAYLPTRPGKNGVPPLSEQTIRIKLGTLRTFFERTSEWGYQDADPTLGDRDAGPDRPAGRRALRFAARRGGPHVCPALATGSGRQTPQRSLRPAAPTARRATPSSPRRP